MTPPTVHAPSSWEAVRQRWRSEGEQASASCKWRDAHGPNSVAPTIALCISGAARSFATPLVLAGLRHHLLDALSPMNVRLFVQLKRSDTTKSLHETNGRMKFDQHDADMQALQESLRQRWLAQLLEEACVVNGSGSFSGVGTVYHTQPQQSMPRQIGSRAPPPAVVPADMHAWRSHRARRCTLSRYLAAGTNEQRLILNHMGQSWCREAILRSEDRRGSRYDLVAFMRPDLVWWRPMLPWCAWRANTSARVRSSVHSSSPTTTGIPPPLLLGDSSPLVSCARTGCDLAWFAPRAHLGALLGQLELHRECAGNAPCCVSPEELLQHAKRVAFCRAQLRDRSIASSQLASCRTSSAPPELDVFTETPARNSVLRSSAACALALGSTANRQEPLSNRQRGLSAITEAWLQTAFGTNIGACERALGVARVLSDEYEYE